MTAKQTFTDWFRKVCEVAQKQFGQNAELLRRQFFQLYDRNIEPAVAVKELYGKD